MSRLISSKNLRQFLFDKFPLLTNNYQVRMSDMYYLLSSLKELKEEVNKHTSKEIQYVPNIGECEEYSCYLRSDIAKSRHIKASQVLIEDNEKFTWAIAEADGILNNEFYSDEPHTMNMAITDDFKIWYIENQSATIFEYNLKHFNIYRIWM